jgi:proteasome accessory factor B
VVSFRARWYVVGQDTDREAPRLFRLSRVQGAVRATGRPGSYVVPEGTDIRALTESLAPAPAGHRARLLVRKGAALGLRRHAETFPDGAPEGWERIEISYGRADALADEVLGYGADVVVEEPADLRGLVVGRLREVAVAGEAR